MKNFACSNLAFAGLLLLALGSTPGTLNGQSQTQGKTATATPVSPVAPEPASACPDSKTLTEQLSETTRTTEQELQAQLANLQEKIAKEVEMNAPELRKLQSLSAQDAGNPDHREGRAEEI